MSSETQRIPAIICGGKTGRAVIYGYVDELPKLDQPVEIHNAKMVLYWPAACGGLLGLAANGPKKNLRLTARVDRVKDTARQVLTVNPDAAKSLDDWSTYYG